MEQYEKSGIRSFAGIYDEGPWGIDSRGGCFKGFEVIGAANAILVEGGDKFSTGWDEDECDEFKEDVVMVTEKIRDEGGVKEEVGAGFGRVEEGDCTVHAEKPR